jgi:hypothetical protein
VHCSADHAGSHFAGSHFGPHILGLTFWASHFGAITNLWGWTSCSPLSEALLPFPAAPRLPDVALAMRQSLEPTKYPSRGKHGTPRTSKQWFNRRDYQTS